MNFSATLLPSLTAQTFINAGLPSENGGWGGSMTLNYLFDSDIPDDEFGEDGMMLIRLYRPAED